MALPFNPGMGGILKEGTKFLTGVDEVIVSNIESAREMMALVRTSMGPMGLNKMVKNEHGKLFVTRHTETILEQLDVEGSPGRMLALAAREQAKEFGDGACMTVVFGGALLSLAESLVRMGIKPSEICAGYERAWKLVEKEIDSLSLGGGDSKFSSLELVQSALESVIGSKLQADLAVTVSSLVSKACFDLYSAGSFDPTRVRVQKILGAGLSQSFLVPGMILLRHVSGKVTRSPTNPLVAVYSCGFDLSSTETKSTLKFRSAQETLDFEVGEEHIMKKLVEEIAGMGVSVVVSNAKFSPLALQFLEAKKILTLVVTSKFDMERLCTATGASAIPRLGKPTAEELGRNCTSVYEDELAEQKFVVVATNSNKLATLVLRGPTDKYLGEVERVVNQALSTFKILSATDARMVAGAGALEMQLAARLRKSLSGTGTGSIEDHAVEKFAEAFEFVVRTLIENAGGANVVNEVLTTLRRAHAENGTCAAGVDLWTNTVVSDTAVKDSLTVRKNSVRLAVDAALDLLRINAIIAARPAGGPAPR